MTKSNRAKPSLMNRLSAALGALRGNLTEPPPWLLSMLGAPTSAAGVDVIPETSITLAAVWDCVNILSQTVGTLPLIVYQNGAAGKKKALNHPLWSILHDRPNPEMTSMVWRMVMMTHLGLWGNHYSQIVRDQIGRPIGLWPIHPQRVRMMRDIITQKLYYTVAPAFGETGLTTIYAPDMLHVKGLSLNGLVGFSPIGAAREAIGLGLAEQEFGARVFSNDATAGAMLEHPGTLSDAAYDRLKRSIEDQTRSLKDKHRMLILEEGMKVNRYALPPEDAQFLASREFNVLEIARFYRMPPYKLGVQVGGKASNVEQMSIEFLTDTIMPWLVNIEQEIALKLMNDAERAQFFAEFFVDGYLRGDTATRYGAYAIARQWGWMSANEIRHAEHMNPIQGGDDYLVPLNMVPADGSKPTAAPTNKPAAPKEVNA